MVKKYELTEEHKAQLKPWADKWIANALSTKPMDDADRAAMRTAIAGLYSAANLPQPDRVVFSPGPITGAVASGLAAGYYAALEDKENAKLEAGQYIAALAQAAQSFFPGNTKAQDCTLATALEACGLPSSGKAVGKPSAPFVKALVEAGKGGLNMRNGGNQWSGWVAFLTFFRYVAKLGETHGIDYSKFDHYEKAAIHAGPRFMHARFCVVTDRPRVLRVENNQPHSAIGPSHVWDDGIRLFYFRGVRVPSEWIEKREQVDPRLVLTHRNMEQRAVLAQILGWDRVLSLLPTRTIDADPDEAVGTLIEVDLPDAPGERFLRVIGPGVQGPRGTYVLGVPKTVKTALEAQAMLAGETVASFSLITRV